MRKAKLNQIMNVNSINNVNFYGYNGKYLSKTKNINILENISSKSIKDIVKNALKIKPKEEVALPVVVVPILAYMQTQKDKIKEKLAKEALKKSDKYFTDNYHDSVEQLKKAGVKGNYEKYIDSTSGRLNSSGNKITNTPFKGAPDDLNTHATTLDEDITSNPSKIYNTSDLSDLDSESREMLDEINNTDMSLPPDLQDIIDMPSIDTPEGFIDTIFGDLPEGMSVDEDIWSMLKNIADDILDFGDWF